MMRTQEGQAYAALTSAALTFTGDLLVGAAWRRV